MKMPCTHGIEANGCGEWVVISSSYQVTGCGGLSRVTSCGDCRRPYQQGGRPRPVRNKTASMETVHDISVLMLHCRPASQPSDLQTSSLARNQTRTGTYAGCNQV